MLTQMFARRKRRVFLTVPSLTLILGLVLVLAAVSAMSVAAQSHLSKGRVPPEAFRADGTIDMALVPDFISVWARDGESIVGYVKSDLVVGPPIKTQSATAQRDENPALPVYGEDLRTIVGYLVPDKGFVPLGVDPDSVPRIPAVVGEDPGT